MKWRRDEIVSRKRLASPDPIPTTKLRLLSGARQWRCTVSSTTTPRSREPIRFVADRSGAACGVSSGGADRIRRSPVFGETEVAKKAGLDPALNLARACSDYYLLSYLRRPHYVAAAAQALDELVQDLAPEFAQYLDMACGGELRHASTWPCELSPCPVLGGGADRSVAWQEWLAWETPLYRAEYAASAFEGASWPSRNYGGEPWALIAGTLHEFLSQRIPPELFIDRVWNLQHHGGIVLNKIYSTADLALVLEAHGSDDHDPLISFASQRTRELWTNTFSQETRTLKEARASLQLWARLAFQPLN
jgi:hypothetical protein